MVSRGTVRAVRRFEHGLGGAGAEDEALEQ